MDKSEVKIIARHLREAPVNLQAIFADLGIEYEEIWMDDASGAITRQGDTFTISVNATESENRRRFTAAHELAHYLYHRDLLSNGKRMHRHVDNLWGSDGEKGDVVFNPSDEVQANRIAAQIVMPKALLEKRYAENPDPSLLAKEFGVSKAAMEIRIKTLGLKR